MATDTWDTAVGDIITGGVEAADITMVGIVADTTDGTNAAVEAWVFAGFPRFAKNIPCKPAEQSAQDVPDRRQTSKPAKPDHAKFASVVAHLWKMGGVEGCGFRDMVRFVTCP